MTHQFTIPDEYQAAFRRFLPHLNAKLHNEPHVIEALLLYYKFGGEKMARVFIEALNVTRRLEDVELVKRMREEAMLSNRNDESDDDDDDDDDEDDDEDDDDEDGDTYDRED